MSCRAMHLSYTVAAWDFNCWFLRPLPCTFDVAAGDHDRGVVAAATPHNLLSPATAMRTIKPGEAIHSAHSTINPSPGTHEAFFASGTRSDPASMYLQLITASFTVDLMH